MINDMTKGPPLGLILWFCVPLLVGNIFQQLYNIADIVIVGRLIGPNALAAVGAVSPLFFILMFVLVGLTNGFAVVTGQKFGAKDTEGVRRSAATSLTLSLVFSTLLTVLVLVFLKPMLSLMNVPQEIFDNAYNYISPVVWGLWTCCLYNLLASIMRALGDSKSPLYVLIIASLLNVLLAILFIAKLHLGVFGAAVALVISQAISCVACIFWIIKKFPILHLKRGDWKLNKNFIMHHLKIGLPMAAQFSVIGLGMLIIQSVCNTFGTQVIGAFTYALRIEQLAIMPMASLGIALAAYTAQNFGARKFSRIRDGVNKTSIVSLGVSIFLAVLMYFFGWEIIKVFAGDIDPNIISIAKSYLAISTVFYCFIGQMFIYRHALQGMGSTVITFLSSVVELFLRTFAAVYLAQKIGYFGIFYAGPIAWIGGSLIVAFGYYSTILKTARKAHSKIRTKRRVVAEGLNVV